MSNNYEDIIKNEVNKYMEQIEVPKNIGGIIMEDFEKIKREEAEVQNYKYDEAVNKKKGSKNKKALKISIAAVSAVVLIGTGVFIGSRFLGRSTTTINNNGAQNSNMATNNQVFDKKITIRNNQIENFGKLNQFLRNVHNGTEDEIEIETYLEPEWELVQSTKEPSKLYVKYDGTKYNVKYDIAEGMRYSKQTVEGEFSDILIRKTISQSTEYIEMELTFYKINDNKLEILPVFFFKLSDVGINPAEGSVKDVLAQDYKTYKKMNDEISNEVYDGLYNLEKDLSDKFGETIYKQKLQQLGIKDESSVINLIKDKETNVQQELGTNQKREITKEEISSIEKFINSGENNPFLFLDYNNPEDIFKNEKNNYDVSYSPGRILLYAVRSSKYTSHATESQNKVIWKESNGEEMQDTCVISENDMIKFLQEKLDYSYTKDTVRKAFKNCLYSELNNVYVCIISDALGTNFTIKNGYKQGNKYYLTLKSNESNNENVEVVLTEKNGTYYFYSCNTNKVKELNKEQISKLETFLNKYENNSFTLLNYVDSTDLLKNINNQPHKDVLKYSIAQSPYCSEATNTQINIIYKGNPIDAGGTYIITEDNLIKYFQEKLNVLYSKQQLKTAFADYFNNDLNMYSFWMSDSAHTKAIIKEACKIDYCYYLTLNHGQKVVLFERSNGEIFFESCTGYDGSIGF